jgi:hypothetical protein
MLAPLHTWINRELQPLAAKQLGAKIVSQVMSDYSAAPPSARGPQAQQCLRRRDIAVSSPRKKQTVHVRGVGRHEPRLIAAAAAAGAGREAGDG